MLPLVRGLERPAPSEDKSNRYFIINPRFLGNFCKVGPRDLVALRQNFHGRLEYFRDRVPLRG